MQEIVCLNTIPDVLLLLWGALLSWSRMCGDTETYEHALEELIKLELSNSRAYVHLSNVYAAMGRWKDVRYVRDLMEVKGIKKMPGCSMVEVADTWEIYMMLSEITNGLKMEGYVGGAKEVLLDLDEEWKEMALSDHCEKFAITWYTDTNC